MTIRYKCETCGSTLKIKDELAGTEGTCPKCKNKFEVPKPDSASDAELNASTAVAVAGSEESGGDEEDIFGKDFFKLQEAPSGPKYTVANFDSEDAAEDDEDDEEIEARAKRTVKPKPSAENAANMAGQLLSKTGKKNRSSDWEEAAAAEKKEQEEGPDFSELKYLLTHRVLPLGGGGIVACLLLYWLVSSMLADKSDLPPLGIVTGKVTVGGQPAADAQVLFYPLPDRPQDPVKGSFSYGQTGADGTYRVEYNPTNPGAVVGKHRVEVTVAGKTYTQETEVAAGKNEKNLDF